MTTGIGRRALLLALLAVAPLALAEVVFQIHAVLTPARRVDILLRRIHPRLRQQWLADEQPTPLQPPFVVYANRGWDDDRRLKSVLAHAKYPPGGSWEIPDFLRDPRPTPGARFSARVNSLGWRDPARALRKPAGVRRIICLGAYHTFGHGVGDSDPYPRRLEALLNAGLKTPRYEVWNAGRQAATAIFGLALLKHELPRYAPDLLIVEYGFPDTAVVDDNFMPLVLRLPSDSPGWRRLKAVLRAAFAAAAGRSQVLSRFLGKVWAAMLRHNIERWEAATAALLENARSLGVPVILLRDSSGNTPRASYDRLLSRFPEAAFVDAHEAFLRLAPGPKRRLAFAQGDTWAREFADSLEALPPYAPYLTDIWHPNRDGHEIIARELLPHVRRLLARRR